MKEWNDLKIIGVDQGYGNMKTANTITPTGLVAYDEEPVFTGDTLVFGGKHYRIGVGHKEFVVDKTADDDFYILTLASIAKELRCAELTKAKIHLAVGLPMTWVGRQREQLRAYLLRNQEVTFLYNDEEYQLQMDGCSVFLQGYPAVLGLVGELQGDVLLADVGNGTMNILYLNDGRPNPAKVWTEKLGVEQCVIAVRSAVMNEFGVVIQDHTIEQVLRTNKAPINKKYLDCIRQTAKEYVAQLFTVLRRHEYDPDLIRLVVAGGGACLVKHFGKQKHNIQIVDDLCAAAKGYEFLALKKLEKEETSHGRVQTADHSL